jgi:inhibitor of cysteine peptidase
MHVGDEFDVLLDENPGTGYRWIVEDAFSPSIELVSNNYEDVGPGVGGGGQCRLRFRGSQPGAFEIRLRYYREWESASSATKTFTLSGVVS